MKSIRGVVLVCCALFLIVGCGERASVTGEFGTLTVRGKVIVEGASPGGIEVVAEGTGMRAEVGESGEFVLVGVPAEPVLRFTRADGIDHSESVDARHQGTHLIKIDARGRGSRSRPVRGRLTQIEGIVETISDSSITVDDAHRGLVTVAIGAETVIRKGQLVLLPAQIVVGDRVHVMANGPNDALVAVQIMLQNSAGERPENATANGVVSAVGANQLSVVTGAGTEVLVNVTVTTEIRSRGQSIFFSSIEVGDRVEAKGLRVDPSTIEAQRINVQHKG
jgi:hypothetical protein